MFPEVSVARTANACCPSTGDTTRNEDAVEHAPNGEPSRLHAKVAGSFAEKVNVTAPATADRFAGPDVIVVVGGVRSDALSLPFPFPFPAAAAAGTRRPRTSAASTSSACAQWRSPAPRVPHTAPNRSPWSKLVIPSMPSTPFRAVRRGPQLPHAPYEPEGACSSPRRG